MIKTYVRHLKSSQDCPTGRQQSLPGRSLLPSWKTDAGCGAPLAGRPEPASSVPRRIPRHPAGGPRARRVGCRACPGQTDQPPSLHKLTPCEPQKPHGCCWQWVSASGLRRAPRDGGRAGQGRSWAVGRPPRECGEAFTTNAPRRPDGDFQGRGTPGCHTGTAAEFRTLHVDGRSRSTATHRARSPQMRVGRRGQQTARRSQAPAAIRRARSAQPRGRLEPAQQPPELGTLPTPTAPRGSRGPGRAGRGAA